MRTWILQRYQVYARLTLLTGLFLAPVIFLRSTVDVFNLVKITSLWVFAILAVALWVMWAAERGAWLPRMRTFWAAGVFLLAQALATIFSQNSGLSMVGLYHRSGGFMPFALYATIALVIVGLYWERPTDLKEVARAATLASLLLAGYVLIQKAGLDWIPWRDSNNLPPTFPVGTMGNSNFAGGYLAIAAPLFAYVVLSARTRSWRMILGAAFALDLLALWFTQTRGALIAAGVALMVWAFLYRDRLPRWVRLATLAAVCAGMLLAVVVVVHPGMREAPGIFSKAGAFSPFRTGTFQDRSYYWITGLRIFRHHPILGTGPDTYYANYPRFRLPAAGAKLGLPITDQPHNVFVEYASNSGILGLGSYLALLGLTLWYGYRRIRDLQGTTQLLLAAFMTTLVAYMVNGFFSIDVPPLAVMGWVALAGIATLADPGAIAARERIAAARQAAPRYRTKKKKAPGPKAAPAPYGGTRVVRQGALRWPAHIAAGVLAVTLVVLGVRPFWADHLAHNGQVAQASNTGPTDAVDTYIRAAGFNQLEPSYQSLAGAVYESQGAAATDQAGKTHWFDLALARYRRALQLPPGNVFY